ncbi:hypothetical protein GGR58DRAFT_485497 [Xylaria digitata]|nr:hypothetical protein GGR58DRAFT_485497 [Xylaria digitata]
MAKDRDLQAGWTEAQHQAKKLRQFFPAVFYSSLCNIFYYISALFSLLSNGHPQADLFGRIHHLSQACNCPYGEEGDHVDKCSASLPDIQFAGPDSRGMRIVAWNLTEANSLIQHEGIITTLPRNLVKNEFVMRGRMYSGIFKIVSVFECPDKSRYRVHGTAFAVTKSHVLTAAHNMWHPKLGPAKNATLFPDARADKRAQYIRKCISAATPSNWIQLHQDEHDFCMVAVAEPFDSEVRILSCHPGPGPSRVKDGEVLGFPFDLPPDAPGRHLIQCKGAVSYHEAQDGVTIKHMVNTVRGNSGSPVIASDQVVGVHTAFMRHERQNRAVPVNQNGNNVDEFSSVLRYVGGEDAGLPRGFCRLKRLAISQSQGAFPILPEFMVFGEDIATA